MKIKQILSRKHLNTWSVLLAIILLSILYWSGLQVVPFHPDESTYIFMSGDLELVINNPGSLFWQPDQLTDFRMHYRLLDPPTSRYLVGIGRSLAGLSALPADWDWSLTWQQNQSAGALPDENLLIVSRAAVAIFFPLSLIFFYLSAQQVFGKLTAWFAMLLLAGNTLVLIHTRRAMSESFLLFAIILTLYFFIHFEQKPWLSAFPVALALNAKLSAAPLAAVGVLWILFAAIRFKWKIKDFFFQIVLYAFVIIAISLLLNPFLWAHPITAGVASWQSRMELTSRQVSTVASVSPQMVLDSFPKRLGNLIAHLFFTPPAIADVANYLDQTASSANRYLANPLHSLARTPAQAGLFLIFSLCGFLFSLFDLIRRKSSALLILFITGFAQIAALLLLVPLPFQRYILPALPFACIWTAHGFATFIQIFREAVNKKSPGQDS